LKAPKGPPFGILAFWPAPGRKELVRAIVG